MVCDGRHIVRSVLIGTIASWEQRPRAYPPGPQRSATLQTLATLARQRPFLERQRRKYGNVFTVQLLGLGPFVVCADPSLVKQVFTADPKVLHAGSGSPLGTVLGRHSLLAIDEERHLEQRKLLLPPFHGRRMQAYEDLIAEIAADEVDRWPAGDEIETADSFMRITLRAILRAVFGAEGDELTRARGAASRLRRARLSHGDADGPAERPRAAQPVGPLPAPRAPASTPCSTGSSSARADDALTERSDVLALLVQATHTDGTPMTDAALRDQLLTLLAAGHETTAGTLAWAVERLRRHPEVLGALVEEVDAGGRTLRDATIREVQRCAPSSRSPRRHVMQPYELAGHHLPRIVRIGLRRVADALRPGALRGARRLRPGPLRRRQARDLLLDPVRRRRPALHRRGVRPHGDGRRPAHGARARRARHRPARPTSTGASAASRTSRPTGGGSSCARGAPQRCQLQRPRRPLGTVRPG